MKKLCKLKLKEFREMSDSEMKNVVGGSFDPWAGGGTGDIGDGSGDVVSCTVSLSCAQGSISCSSSIGDCENVWEDNVMVAIRCEKSTYSCK
ncbi:TIGR04149 family rSAM-modified RiPP [Bacteroides sp. GM023]|uniref:TIGR04149 family rSAM-modified RiPP n=1 Tax=Bacteroides sp. GM023 TaxID=2723058 RepID=UPI00168B0646|nr:TIGR04149 family rSAM-modified RiPP [Bacteroides sp. GM023]MBD3588369.1 rSAM-modified peptide [Bacteroides sp. GM023]